MIHSTLTFLKETFLPAAQNTPPQRADNQLITRKRIEFIDLAKGVCIILVVMLHCDINFSLPQLRLLRMPLYFILSGLFFKDYGGWGRLLEKKINRILIPFLFFCLLTYLILKICEYFNLNRTVDSILDTVRFNFPIWFLLCLFFVNLLYGVISQYIRNQVAMTIVCLLLGLFGYLLDTYSLRIGLYIDGALAAMPFFQFGVLLKKTPLLFPNKYDNYSWVIGMGMLVIGYVLVSLAGDPAIGFRDNSYVGNILITWLLSAITVVGTLLVLKSVRWCPFISYVGRYSIIVLGLHAIFIQALIQLGFDMGSEMLFFICLFITWLSIPVCRKYLPWFTAQKDCFHFPCNSKANI